MRFLPKSLLGQVMLAVAVALLTAQAISAVLLFDAAKQRREQAMVNAAAFRLVVPPRDRFAADGANRNRRAMRRMRRDHRRGEVRLPSVYQRSDRSPIRDAETRLPEREEALGAILLNQGVTVDEIIVTTRHAGSDAFLRQPGRRMARFRRNPGWEDRPIMVAGLLRDGSNEWEIVRVAQPASDRNAIGILAGQTLLLFAILVAALYVLLSRITRPLASLTEQVQRFSRNRQPGEPMVPSGPADIRELIVAHNSMEARIGAMLHEKDVMLGAIGHDLKTPLAALRVRIESVEDDTQRARMAASIEDITQTLDDILSLARIGKAGQATELPERTDLRALAASVVEEFEDIGQPVTLEDGPRITHRVYVTWLKRALRNLVSNAVRYGNQAHVTIASDETGIMLCVDDTGPGIPDDRMAAMLEPFTRGEASRNRSTGGAGLGLTLASAIADQHGGALILRNRAGGGLNATITLPHDN